MSFFEYTPTSFPAYNGKYINEDRPIPAYCSKFNTPQAHLPADDPHYTDFSMIIPVLAAVASIGFGACCIIATEPSLKAKKRDVPLDNVSVDDSAMNDESPDNEAGANERNSVSQEGDENAVIDAPSDSNAPVE